VSWFYITRRPGKSRQPSFGLFVAHSSSSSFSETQLMNEFIEKERRRKNKGRRKQSKTISSRLLID